MKKLFFALAALIASISINAQGLFIDAGTQFITTGNVDIVIENGDFTNNSNNADFTASNLYMSGTDDNKIGGTGNNTFRNIYVNKNGAELSLTDDITINSKLIFQKGNLDLNKHNITLDKSAVIEDESNNKRILGKGGEVLITLKLNAPNKQNPGNIGAEITSSQNLGTVTIARGHKVQQDLDGGESIKRYYTITPANNSNLNATLRFNYFNNELNGITESDLSMWRSSNNGASWSDKGFTARNATKHFVELAGISAFAMYTLGGAATFAQRTEEQIAVAQKNKNIELSKLFTLQVLPNPATNQQAHIRIQAPYATQANVSVVAADGKTIAQLPAKLHAGLNELPFNTVKFASGSYYFTLKTTEGVQKTLTFIKQ